MVLTEIDRGPAILEALAECREIAAQVVDYERRAIELSRAPITAGGTHARAYLMCVGASACSGLLRRSLLNFGNLMVGR